jgi:hypothetical protein
VPAVIEYLHSDRHIKRAAHPAISAWRCTVDGIMHSDNDDDGESAAGSRLAHLLQILVRTSYHLLSMSLFGSKTGRSIMYNAQCRR